MSILKVRFSEGKALKIVSGTKAVSFKDWGMKESDVENFVTENISAVMGEDTGLLIVGEQVVDEAGKKNDLVALDSDGSLVLIEIKRDKADMESRHEQLEFQAIRYCASLATITTIDQLVDVMASKYFAAHDAGYKGDRPIEERAKEKIEDFLQGNGSLDDFNEKQRIVLISSGYDDSTKSACAWLVKSGVDITLVQLQPVEVDGDMQIDVKQIMPPDSLEDSFVPFKEGEKKPGSSPKGDHQRKSLPRMADLFEWGIVKPGDAVYLRGRREASLAKVVDSSTVEFKGSEMTFNEWGNLVTGWSATPIYDVTFLDGQSDPKSLAQMRTEYMLSHKEKD
jgi:hypothetical protein